jgi:prepilin-type N-terminal cleavage/methylation domain-containing protein
MKKINKKGFTLMEVIVAIAVFGLFALGIYGGIHLVFKIVYSSRMRILETAILAEQLEVVRNLPYESVGIISGVPSGLLYGATSTVRNGVIFDIAVTVRNIDDPFDGTITGTPHDSSPADYKLVEMSIICRQCQQQVPIILNTVVAPKQLEGATNNGALFIQVFDAEGIPVQGASVDVTNTARTPLVVIHDTTDNDGYVRIIDTPTGTQSYNIRVAKSGYSTDYTVSSTVANPNPLRQPSTVVSQEITDISFIIDRLSTMNLNSINQTCSIVVNVPFYIYGEKVLGTSPDVYKFIGTYTTNGSGNYSLANIEYDKYHISISTTAYDIAGSIPFLPVDLIPGLNQNVSLILRAHAANTLLVQVKDAGTGLPLSSASVRLSGTGFDETVATGEGYLRQTDWSGGGGQAAFTNETKYYADNGNLNCSNPAGDVKLKKSGSRYLNSGNLESSTFDFGGAVDYHNIIFKSTTQPAQTGSNPITLQIATSNSSSPASWNFAGPDGTGATFYTATSSLIHSGNDSKRYLRYKVFLNTANTSYTPTLSEVSITFTNSCTPPGQAFFSGFSAGPYTLEISRSGYTANSGLLDLAGNMQTVVNMSP